MDNVLGIMFCCKVGVFFCVRYFLVPVFLKKDEKNDSKNVKLPLKLAPIRMIVFKTSFLAVKSANFLRIWGHRFGLFLCIFQ